MNATGQAACSSDDPGLRLASGLALRLDWLSQSRLRPGIWPPFYVTADVALARYGVGIDKLYTIGRMPTHHRYRQSLAALSAGRKATSRSW